MQSNILAFCASLEDPRRAQGMRHQFHHIMIMVIMAILSNHQGLRGFARFAKANAAELTEIFELKHGVPKFNTFQSVLNSLDEQILVSKFIEWVKSYVDEDADDFIALDGKAVTATVTGGTSSNQNFVAVVNAFGHRSGIVYGMESYENGKSGEGEAVRKLLEKLGLQGKTFTMDAGNCQKKHLT